GWRALPLTETSHDDIMQSQQRLQDLLADLALLRARAERVCQETQDLLIRYHLVVDSTRETLLTCPDSSLRSNRPASERENRELAVSTSSISCPRARRRNPPFWKVTSLQPLLHMSGRMSAGGRKRYSGRGTKHQIFTTRFSEH